MDFQKVMNMIDDISQHLPEQKYIEIVNNLKKEYDNTNDDDDDYCEIIKTLFHQLEYELYYYINKKIILFKDDDDATIEEAIDILLDNHCYNIEKITEFYTDYTEHLLKIKNGMIWDFIEIINCKKIIIKNMTGNDNCFYNDDLEERNQYFDAFGELALESALWYFRQEFQTKNYIDKCWSRLYLDYDKCYDGKCYYLLKDIQFPNDYFDGMRPKLFHQM